MYRSVLGSSRGATRELTRCSRCLRFSPSTRLASTATAAASTNRSDFDDPHLAQPADSMEELTNRMKTTSARSRTPQPHKTRVRYKAGSAGVSNEHRLFFASTLEKEIAGWGTEEASEAGMGELGPGRVVEIRRSEVTTIGLILAPITVSGRSRLLLLRPTGDIWPISSQDVQFLMPSSLVSPEMTQACWSPDLLEAYASGDETAITQLESSTPGMLEARRKVVMILRKILKETEKMTGRLLSSGNDLEDIWDQLAPSESQERGSATAAQVAEMLLQSKGEGEGKRKPVGANTLPAFTAHGMMMRRPDLFMGDPGEMWESGVYLVRSRAEREIFDKVAKWVGKATPEDRATLERFAERVRKVIQLNSNGGDPENLSWISSDLDIIWVILNRLYETRSTQASPSNPLYIQILQELNLYPGEYFEQPLIARFLGDVGVLPPHDSLEMSKSTETSSRSRAMAGVPPKHSGSDVTENDLLKGTELEELYEDFTHHKVYVVDDPDASELDDGIALERLDNGDQWVHIHIADPTRCLHPSHPISVQASFAGSAIYLPEGKYPLLPIPEVMQKLSLGAQTESGSQGVMTFSARIDGKGELQESKVRLGRISRPRVITYGAVNTALGISPPPSTKPFGIPPGISAGTRTAAEIDEGDLPDLQLLFDLAGKMRKHRVKDGGFEYIQSSNSISLVNPPPLRENLFDRQQMYKSINVNYPSPIINYTCLPPVATLTSGAMVGEYMILAGRIAAQFLSDRKIPAPFKGTSPMITISSPMSRDSGKAMTIEDLLAKRDEYGFIDAYEILSANTLISAGTTSTFPQPHWFMGFAKNDHGYVRATSPLRRYEDLLVHWQIKAALALEKGIDLPYKSFTRSEMEVLVKRSDTAGKKVKRSGKVANQFWATRLVRDRLTGPVSDDWTHPDGILDIRGEMFARVLQNTSSGSSVLGESDTQVKLDALGIAMLLKADQNKRYQVGEEVRVKVREAVQWPAPQVVLVPV